MNTDVLENMAIRYLQAVNDGEPHEAAEHAALTYYSYKQLDADIPEAMATLNRMHRHIEEFTRRKAVA